jgi:ribosome biogenesis GTPase A
MQIHWYPGHMAKAKRQIDEKLKLISVAVIAVDARAPLSTLSPDLTAQLSGKSCIILLNKSDLADPEQTKLWTAYYKRRFGSALAFSATKDKPAKLLAVIREAAAPIVQRYAAKGMRKTVRVLIAGIPNVGKSAIINRLVGQKSAKEGDKPGVTRGLQWVRLSDTLELLDSPGLLWPKLEPPEAAERIAALGSLRSEVIDGVALAEKLIGMLRDVAPGAVAARYGVEEGPDVHRVFEQICKKRGFLRRQGEIDDQRGARVLLDEFQGGKLGRITLERCDSVSGDGESAERGEYETQ